jgi:hypothetical protein
LEGVFEAAVVLFQDRVLCREVKGKDTVQGILQASMGKLGDLLLGVEESHSHSRTFEIKYLPSLLFSAFALEYKLKFSSLSSKLGCQILITKQCLAITIGLVHPGINLGTFFNSIASVNEVPPKLFIIFALAHPISHVGEMFGHFTETFAYFIAFIASSTI